MHPSFFWAGQAFLRHNVLPWEFLGFTPMERGWLISLMEEAISAEQRRSGGAQNDDEGTAD